MELHNDTVTWSQQFRNLTVQKFNGISIQYARRNKQWIIDNHFQDIIKHMCWSLINIYAFKWVIWIPFAMFYWYLLSLYRLKIYYEVYILFLEYIPICEELPIELYHFFNSGNISYHFKLMGCSSLPWPHQYRHKGQNEPVTKVTTIHFTPERSSPPVSRGLLLIDTYK